MKLQLALALSLVTFAATGSAFAADSCFANKPTLACMDYVLEHKPGTDLVDAAKKCAGTPSQECVDYVQKEDAHLTIVDATQTCAGGASVGCLKETQDKYHLNVRQAGAFCSPRSSR